MHAFREDGRILKLVAGLTAALIGAVLYTARIDPGWANPEPETPAVSARPPPTATSSRVSALGRLEPRDGLRRISGPSATSVVIGRLLVDEGDTVKEGQRIAVLDIAELVEADVERHAAELANAEHELDRYLKLNERRITSESERDDRELRVRVARASLRKARAERDRSYVDSPIDGQVIWVHAREGERVGSEGIVELGRTGEMYAIAEVYETDIARVKPGQRATVSSPGMPEVLTGTVERIDLAVGKMDTLGTDPAARKDARVVEVEIRLDDSRVARGLTNLQVEVEIEP
jgi:HlyD family secretion protein